jgi:hypothetical protein
MQVAEIIKEDLWPNPLKYFNNVSVFVTALLINLNSLYLVLNFSLLCRRLKMSSKEMKKMMMM